MSALPARSSVRLTLRGGSGASLVVDSSNALEIAQEMMDPNKAWSLVRVFGRQTLVQHSQITTIAIEPGRSAQADETMTVELCSGSKGERLIEIAGLSVGDLLFLAGRLIDPSRNWVEVRPSSGYLTFVQVAHVTTVVVDPGPGEFIDWARIGL